MTYLASSRAAKSKTKLPAVVLLIVIALTAFALVACKKAKKDITLEINNAEDLKAIAGYVDSGEYGILTVVLNADIDLAGENWTPIGSSYENSFTGVFDGKGHKITGIDMQGTPQQEGTENVADGSIAVSEYNPTETKFVGLFGFISDAEVKDLEISYSAKLRMGKEPVSDGDNIDFDTLYFGGFAGYAYGDCSYSNVNVNGSIDFVVSIYSELNRKGNLVNPNKYDAFVGGLVGYSVGTTKATSISSDVEIDLRNNEILASEHQEYKLGENAQSRFNDVQVGGIFGYVRTIDISLGQNDENTIEDSVSFVNAEVNAENVFLGGIAGSIYNGTIKNVEIKSSSSMVINAAIRGELGGVVGLIDNGIIKNAYIPKITLEGDMVSGGKNAELITSNIGGVAGYATNNSLIDTAYVKATIASIECVEYAGGIAGVLNGSHITNTAAEGDYKIEVNGNTVKPSRYSNYDFKFGGLVGRAHAKAVIESSATSFASPKAVVGAVTQKIVYKKYTKTNSDGEDEDYFEKDEENSLPRLVEDTVTGDMVMENYVNDETVTFNSTVTLDTASVAGSGEEGKVQYTLLLSGILTALGK